MDAVLVSGGAGYIGSHVCKALHAAGFLPVVYDDLSRGRRAAVRWGPLIEGDIRERAGLDAAIAAYRPVGALHFAALADVGESMREPERYRSVNVEGSRSFFEACATGGIGHVVFSSTCAVYGAPTHMPIGESTPQAPVNPYGESKRAGEELLAAHAARGEFRHVALRYFNAAGSDPEEPTLGEHRVPDNHLIPRTVQAALGMAPPLKLYGTDYPTADGTAIRDYVHVLDLATAHVSALSYLRGGGGSTALNLGTGRGVSVREVIAAVAAETGCEVPLEEAPRRPGDPPVLYADATRSRALLDWTPQFSDLPRIVRDAHLRQQHLREELGRH
jgi:UDP-glucose-4-epimerase GalE